MPKSKNLNLNLSRNVTKEEWQAWVKTRRGTPNFFLDYLLFSKEHYNPGELMANLWKKDTPEVQPPKK